jgi:hypothetical protein
MKADAEDTATKTQEDRTMRKIKDKNGRTWEHCDSEGTWSRKAEETGRFVMIGCGINNGSKWMIWNDKNGEQVRWEYDTLREAMQDA